MIIIIIKINYDINWLNTNFEFKLCLIKPSSIIVWTQLASSFGNGGWCILVNAPSGGFKIFWTYGCGLGFSFKYKAWANS